MNTRYCKFCNNQFEKKHNRQMYCKPECRLAYYKKYSYWSKLTEGERKQLAKKKWLKVKPKYSKEQLESTRITICAICGNEIINKFCIQRGRFPRDKKYCSKKCLYKACYALHLKNHPKPETRCKYCNEIIHYPQRTICKSPICKKKLDCHTRIEWKKTDEYKKRKLEYYRNNRGKLNECSSLCSKFHTTKIPIEIKKALAFAKLGERIVAERNYIPINKSQIKEKINQINEGKTYVAYE